MNAQVRKFFRDAEKLRHSGAWLTCESCLWWKARKRGVCTAHVPQWLDNSNDVPCEEHMPPKTPADYCDAYLPREDHGALERQRYAKKVRMARAISAVKRLRAQGRDPAMMTDAELLHVGNLGHKSILALRELVSKDRPICPHCGLPVDVPPSQVRAASRMEAAQTAVQPCSPVQP